MTFLDDMKASFGIDRSDRNGCKRGVDNLCFIDMPLFSIPSTYSLVGDGFRHCMDAFDCLFGAELDIGSHYSDTSPCFAPYVAFIAGQYGVGKTELIHQLDGDLGRVTSDVVQLLPIALSGCRESFLNLADDDGMKIPFFLEPHIEHESDDLRNVMVSIAHGNLVLALDALDELVFDVSEFNAFMHYFDDFLRKLTEYADPQNFKTRIIITMRTELLNSVGYVETNSISRKLNLAGKNNLEAYFFELDFFGRSEVIGYIDQRFELSEDIKISDNTKALVNNTINVGAVFRMLQRPLLLRIFCDICVGYRDDSKLSDFLERLVNDAEPSFIVGIFVENALRDADLVLAQSGICDAGWNPDKIAERALDMYQHSREVLEFSDLKRMIENEFTAADELPEKVFIQAMHKCPFFSIDPAKREAEFSHRIFLEYFTALGMYGSKNSKDEKFPLFDRLVLNVDMRKFLRGIVVGETQDPQRWYDWTRNSYGLEGKELANWREGILSESDIEVFEKIRCNLLDVMTYASVDEENRFHDICLLFKKIKENFHPRYGIFTFESVAVYLIIFGRTERSLRLSEEFSEILSNELINLIRILDENTEHHDREAIELLLERIISIAFRLNYKWVFLKPRFELISRIIQFTDVRDRVSALFREYAGFRISELATKE